MQKNKLNRGVFFFSLLILFACEFNKTISISLKYLKFTVFIRYRKISIFAIKNKVR